MNKIIVLGVSMHLKQDLRNRTTAGLMQHACNILK